MRAPSSILVLRLLLLLMAAGAVLAGVAIAFSGRDPGAHASRYVCPMHPEVRTPAPGQCPICQMALEPLQPDPAARSRGGVAGTADLVAVDNVRKHKIIDFVRVRSLLPNLREIRGPAWVDDDGAISAIFYNDQIAALLPDEPGAFSPTAAPHTTVAVARMAGPPVARDRSTSLIRFRVAASGGDLHPDQVGWLRLASKPRAVLGVPASAVLQAPEGPYVLLWAGAQRFEKRSIAIGETFSRQGFAVVLDGLRASDRVVARATFFLDVDRRLAGGDEVGLGAPGDPP